MRRRLIFCSLVAVMGCGAPGMTGKIPTGTPSRAFDPDGDGKSDGTQYDLDGDGSFDAVDTDGNGLLDGGDFDGDGVVTLFTSLGTGLEMPSDEERATYPEDVDPDFEGDLNEEKADGPAATVTTKQAVDLSALFPKPVNQGKLSSCAAFVTAEIATAHRAKREGVSPDTVWASPQFLYARMLSHFNSMCNSNTSLLTGLGSLVIEGATPNAKLPYSDMMCAMDPKLEEGDAYRVGTFTWLSKVNRDTIKEHLSAGEPLAIGLPLPANFARLAGPDAKKVFKSEPGQLGGPHGGGHAMVLVGYDDAKSAYKILNSWGADWGDGGYFWWDYADFEAQQGIMAVAVTPYPDQQPAPKFVEPNDLQLTVSKAVVARGASGDRLIVKLHSNAAILTLAAIIDEQPPKEVKQFIAHGNLTVRSDLPLAPGMHTLKLLVAVPRSLNVKDLLTNKVERALTVTVGDPVTDPDGKL
jgi:hypothetical protein